MPTPTPTKTTLKDTNLLFKKTIKKQIDVIRRAPKGSKLTSANQHILDLNDSSSVWAAAGELDVAGLAYYSVTCDLALTNFTSIKAVNFSASGWGVAAAIFEAELAGAFVIDPATVGGSCNWVLAGGAVEEGVVSLTLLTNSGSLIGTFAGPAGGAGIFTWKDDNGNLQIIGG